MIAIPDAPDIPLAAKVAFVARTDSSRVPRDVVDDDRLAHLPGVI